MSTAFYHRHDHAVIVFADTLQWTPALELVDTLDTLVELYFYALVELVVSSPGGEVRALHYVLDAMEAHRAQGVRIRTRVLSHAESAAAVLVCLGDERHLRPRHRRVLRDTRRRTLRAPPPASVHAPPAGPAAHRIHRALTARSNLAAMTRSELSKRMAHRHPQLVERRMLEHMAASLAAGRRIEIRRFGRFSLRFRAARVCAHVERPCLDCDVQRGVKFGVLRRVVPPGVREHAGCGKRRRSRSPARGKADK